MDTIKKNQTAGQKKHYGPRLVGEILHDYLENSNEPLADAFREHATEDVYQGWHPNTELSVDLKTLLRKDIRMVTGKEYHGVLRRDADADIKEYRSYDPHFTFIETERQKDGKRNPHIFDGKYITVTRRGDGSLRLNFKELKNGEDFNLERYALGVYNEICLALAGLIEEV